MCEGDHTEAEFRIMGQTLEQLRTNTFWTALGALSGWVAIAIALAIVILA